MLRELVIYCESKIQAKTSYFLAVVVVPTQED